MGGYSSSPSFRTKIYIAGIALVILAILALQYFWFSNSANSTIESTHRAISTSIYQTVSREYHRYDSLLSNIRLAQEGGFISEESLRRFLETLLSEYGPERTDLRLLKYIGYQKMDSPEEAPHVIRQKDSWTRERVPAIEDLPSEVVRRLTAGDQIVHSEGRALAEDILIFQTAELSGTTYRVGLVLDLDGFFSLYVEPAVASALAEYSITWEQYTTPPLPYEESAPQNQRRYWFNPLRGIFLRTPKNHSDSGYAVYIPRIPTMEEVWNAQTGALSPRGEDIGYSGRYRSILAPTQSEIQNFPGYFRVAIVRLPNSSLEEAIEQRLSFSWLGGSALLIGVGFAFSFVLLQHDRLTRLRTQEREFVAAITHELKTPLTVIRSATENIKTGIVPQEKLEQYADLIGEESDRLCRMIDEVLSFSRMESDSSTSTAQEEIGTWIFFKSLRSMMDPLAEQAGIQTQWDTKAMPPVFMGEKNGLELILGNLIANAVYHAYPGKNRGVIRILARPSRRKTLLFIVEDDGRGIPSKEARHIFDPFYRDTFSREHQEKGSGLGLYLAKRKASFFRGTLRLESPYRRSDGSLKPGCRFILELPQPLEEKRES